VVHLDLAQEPPGRPDPPRIAEQLLQHRQVDGVEPDEDRRVAVVVGLGEDAA
jgi:hypothetical protein